MRAFYIIIALMSIIHSAQAQNSLNLGFEEWDESTLLNTSIGDEKGYHIENAKIAKLENWIKYGGYTVRTTDATEGEYAIVLNNWYGTNDDYIASGTNGSINPRYADNCIHSIPYKPLSVTGDYKLISLSEGLDSIRGKIDIYLTRYNNSTGVRDTIGQANLSFSPTDSNYRSFQQFISYSSVDINPDSIILLASVIGYGEVDTSDHCLNCMYFYLDNLELDTVNLIGDVIQEQPMQLEIYPNPFINVISIANRSQKEVWAVLTTLSGIEVTSIRIAPKSKNNISTADLKSGVYLLHENHRTTKIVKL